MSDQLSQGSMPMKILVIGDFSGSNVENVLHTPISRDNFQNVMSEVSPRLLIRVANKLLSGQKDMNLDLSFTDMSSFHPDCIAEQISPVKETIEVRKILNDLLERKLSVADLKSCKEKFEKTGMTEAISMLDTVDQAESINKCIDKLDRALSEQFDEIMHHPRFQQLESSWRGLMLLIDKSDFPGRVYFEILNVSRSAMLDEFEKRIFQNEYDDASEIPLSLILCDFEFTQQIDDLNIIQRMADRASIIQAAFVASLAPEFFGMRNIIHLIALPNLLKQLSGQALNVWANFLQSQQARWVSLTMNRFLLRDIYGSDQKQAESFKYTEKADPSHPEYYLLGHPIWLMGHNIARSFANNGNCLSISGLGLGGEYAGIPVREYPVSMTEKVKMPLEITLAEDKVWNFINAGITPLNAESNSNIAYFPLSANAYRLQGVTLHSTLSYHLYIGHIFHQYYRLHQQIPAGSSQEEIASFVQSRIYELIAPFGGNNPDETVEVDVSPSNEGNNLYIVGTHVKPKFQIESKDVEFTLQLQTQV